MDSDINFIINDGEKSSKKMQKTSTYFRTIVAFHNLRDRAKETVDSWHERSLGDRIQNGWNNTKKAVSSKTRKFFTHPENSPCEHIPEKYSYVFRPKSQWELILLSGTVCGIEFCYAAETAFVTPILLSLGLSIKFVTMIWCLSPLVGLFLTPILGSMSDSCESKFGRRRPFIIMYSIGILLGLILVPNGHHIGKALGDKPKDLGNQNLIVILNGTTGENVGRENRNTDWHEKLLINGSEFSKEPDLKDKISNPQINIKNITKLRSYSGTSKQEETLQFNNESGLSIIANSHEINSNRNFEKNDKMSQRQFDKEDMFPNFKNGHMHLEFRNKYNDHGNVFQKFIKMKENTSNSDFGSDDRLKMINQNFKIFLTLQNDEEDINPSLQRINDEKGSKRESFEIERENLEDDFSSIVDKIDFEKDFRDDLNDKNYSLQFDLKNSTKESPRRINDQLKFLTKNLSFSPKIFNTLSKDPYSFATHPRFQHDLKNEQSMSSFEGKRREQGNSLVFSSLIDDEKQNESNIIIEKINKKSSEISANEKDQKQQYTDDSTTASHIQPWSIAFTVIGTVLLDFCSDACQSPSRTYLLDVSIPSDHAAGLSTFTVMAGLGGSIGYAMGALHWETTFIGQILGGQVNAVFMIVTIIFLICLVITVTSFPEIPLSVLKDPKMYKEYIRKFREEPAKENENEMSVINTKPKRYGSTDETNGAIKNENEQIEEIASASQMKLEILPTEKEAPLSAKDLYEQYPKEYSTSSLDVSQSVMINVIEELSSSNEYPTLKEYLLSIIHMPNSLRILCLTNLFCWMSLVCYSLYFTDFVGECVYKGDPRAPEDSPTYKLYQDGVSFGCWGMALYSISCSIYSIFIDALIKKFGAKPVYIGGQMVYSAGMVIMALTRHKAAVILLSPTAGIMYSTLFTMPYLLIAHYHSSNQFSDGKKGSDHKIRGIGTDVAAVSSMVFLSQFILSLSMGSIVEAIGSNVVPVCTAALLSALGALSATQVTYLDI